MASQSGAICEPERAYARFGARRTERSTGIERQQKDIALINMSMECDIPAYFCERVCEAFFCTLKSPYECNLLAACVAQKIAESTNGMQMREICKFLQTLLNALKTYQ